MMLASGHNPLFRRIYRKRDEELIIKYAKKYGLGARGIAALLRRKNGMKIENNYVGKMLKMKGLASEERNNKGRKKPWVIYERYRYLRAIQEVIVYHGTQFTTNKRDKRGRARHRFEEHCDKYANQVGIHSLQSSAEQRKIRAPEPELLENKE